MTAKMAKRTLLRDYDPARLRRVLAIFFVALAVPTAVLVWQAYKRLEFETFFQYRAQAEALSAQIDNQLQAGVSTLDGLAANDFTFISTVGNVYQRSPLSNLPPRADVPGVIGYFQIDTSGALTTPYVPQSGISAADIGIAADELARRRSVEDRIRSILSDNALVDARDDEALTERDDAGEGAAAITQFSSAEDRPADLATNERAPAEASARQSLNNLGRLDELRLDEALQQKSEQRVQRIALEEAELVPERERTEGDAAKRARALSTAAPSAPAVAPEPQAADADVAIDTFARSLESFEFSLLDSGHLVLFRNAWGDEQRLVQGLLIEADAFYEQAIETAFRSSPLASMSDLVLGFRNDILTVLRAERSRAYPVSAADLQGDLLHRARLTAPFSDLELVFSITRLPAGPAGQVLAWTTLVIVLVILGGIYALYRLGLNQIRLARQQQDFVSAVSHELKTPLTSIRMYGEMLKEGWADDEKRAQYYEYIHEESERLTRLISNVLELARITRNEPQFDLQARSVAELLDQVRSKISNQVEQAGFELDISPSPDASTAFVRLDEDCFAQIVINLVDNAIKFSAGADERKIHIGCEPVGDDRIAFTVRDHGPGIPADQLEKIFRLFYRSESELTRETVGTGIGLAIVHQLATAMGGTVDVVNRDPGAEFRVSFPRIAAT